MSTLETQENTYLNQKEHETALIMANAAELSFAVIKKVAGNDISNAINGSVITRDVIQNIVLSKIVDKVLTA